jgi:hypothetical protein
MTTRNDITGDEIKTKEITDKYRENFDLIFGKSEQKQQPKEKLKPCQLHGEDE